MLLILSAAAAPVRAESGSLSCSGFIRQSDGLWRSLADDDILGPSGLVHVRAGERLSPADTSKKGDLARALQQLCGG